MKTGASSLVETALNAGVEICFANGILRYKNPLIEVAERREWVSPAV